MSEMRFVVLGAGSWGTALAIHLARQQHEVVLWGHHAPMMQTLQAARVNQYYLPKSPFPPKLAICSDLAQAFASEKQTIVLLAVPSHAFSQTLLKIKPFLAANVIGILWGTKGLSPQGELLHTICQQHCPQLPMGVLSGPSFAAEVAQGLPSAVTIATNEISFGEILLSAFHSEVFRTYLSNDLIGVQLGGAVKNVLAIAVGMSDGLGFGANARCALITRGLAELSRLALKLQAQLSTVMGLSGVGDMVLTCTDNQSRNRRFGLALGEGHSSEQAEKAIGQVVEGKTNAQQVMLLANQQQVEMPICEQVTAVLYHQVLPQQAVDNLLKRSPKSETF